MEVFIGGAYLMQFSDNSGSRFLRICTLTDKPKIQSISFPIENAKFVVLTTIKIGATK